MRPLTIYWDERVLDHDTGPALHETKPSPWIDAPEPHTEGPARLRAMHSVLRNGPLTSHLAWGTGRLATEAELQTVHDAEYLAAVRDLSSAGGGWITGTTRVGADSYTALRAAAGTALEAAAAVLDGQTRMAYALVRPPGHHAQSAVADGYCMFNHAALAAELALRSGLERILTVDWDVHHGNGTQDIFYRRRDVLTTSIHMNHGAWGPSHPQTGWVDETGSGDGAGYNVNIPLPLGAGDSGYVRAFDEIIAPLAQAYQPQLIIAASGQDASAFDPNGRHNVTMSGFRAIGQRLAALADEHCQGRIVLVQEGGYNPSYAPYCLLATLEGLLGTTEVTPDPLAYVPDQTSGLTEALADVADAHHQSWAALRPGPTEN
ncbi:acetylpolyamine aminohydrolase [Mycolicibacterium litorale]|uniref:Acetylpolyamine aminohydrolase n=1 Tax=Mycolicibacterium litorale TaxID=758802 RepID=A0A6S6NX91_9MYCO|nr:acetylpolyamine aminohydrolase [Mycolicibacterium litorale]